MQRNLLFGLQRSNNLLFSNQNNKIPFWNVKFVFVKMANKDFSSLANRYGIMCKNLVENPEQRTNYWEKKGKKLIKWKKVY